MCPLPATVFQGFFFFFLRWPLTVLMKQTSQAVCVFKHSIFLICLWVISSLLTSYVCTQMFIVDYRHLWFVPAKALKEKKKVGQCSDQV